MNLAEALRSSLESLLASGNLEIRENSGRVTPLTPLSWEVRGASEKPLLHLWAENYNVTRRVVAITDQSDDRVALAVETFGKTQPQRMDLVRIAFQRSAKRISREGFCDQLRRILAEQFPDERVEKLSIASDLEHTLSRIYARGVSAKGPVRSAFLAVPQGETQDAIESSLTYALLWLQHERASGRKTQISFLRLIVPEKTAALLTDRLAALHPQLAVQLYEFTSSTEEITRVDPSANGNINTWLVPRREIELLKSRANEALNPVVAVCPHAITMHAVPPEQIVVLRFRGLTFAHWKDGQVYFGIGAKSEPLCAASENKLKHLLTRLNDVRTPLGSIRQPLYRVQAERWMQMLVASDVSRVDIHLDPSHLYEQVFAHSGGQHGVLDLLAVTRTKRLAILELKATENPDLPLQAAAYWSRVRRHQAHGDFARYGYFPGIELQPAPPLVYLIAPTLRFHPTTATILSYLTPEIEVVRVGISEDWRRGLRVTTRH
jgi:hypothetical protein